MLTRKEATAIYGAGPDAVVAALMGLSESNDRLNAALREQIKKNEQLQGALHEMENEIQQLKSESEPSPTTPSGQIPLYLKPTCKRRRRKPGRKTGHPGSARKRPGHVDEVVKHPLNCCPYCNTKLSGKPLEIRSHFVEDIPPEVTVKVTEHQIERKWCPRCRKIVEPPIEDTCPNSPIGLHLVVLTAFLHYFIGISVDNVRRILRHLCGLAITKGGLVQMWMRLAFLMRPEYERIAQKARKSSVLYADETGWRLNGKTCWLWAFTGKNFCYYIIDHCRGSPVLNEFFKQFYGGILISDFWGAYNKITARAKQKCILHLLRELLKVDKSNHSDEWKAWRKKFKRLLKDALHLWGRHKQLSEDVYQHRKEQLHTRLDKIARTQVQDKDIRRLLKRLRRHQHELFTFLDHPDTVSPYNNHAEQQIRPAVIQRKIIQQNRSEQGIETQAILMSIFRTFHMQGLNPVEQTLDLCHSIKRTKKNPHNTTDREKVLYNFSKS
jgi:transposase